MKANKIFLLTLFLMLAAIISLGAVAATEDNNITDDSSLLSVNNESDYSLDENTLTASDEENSLLSAPKTIEVDNYGESHNEMNEHTIKNAVESANAGDTLLIKGSEYVHVHVTINKQLTIKSDVATKMEPCSSTADSGYQGMFYLTSDASGSIIEGFSFSGVYGTDGYGILINGASNVIIRNCNFSDMGSGDAIRLLNSKNTQIYNVNIDSANNGIRIRNSQATSIKTSNIKSSNYGIYENDSTNSIIDSNSISNNKNAGIAYEGTSDNPKISNNNITNNKNGINLISSTNSIHTDILNNYIALNNGYGVYINCPVEKINVIGNFFYKNDNSEVFNDLNTKGLWAEGGEKLEVVNNNYVVGKDNRPVHRSDSVGGGVFLGYIFELNTYIYCPVIYHTFGTVKWYEGHYWLKLSEITQSKKGMYSISIVDDEGNVAKGLSSVPVTFYLNKNNNYVAPQAGDIYKIVMMVDGTATVRFSASDFKQSGNVVTVVMPGTSDYLTGDQNKNIKTFTVDDDYIPGSPSATKITLSNLNTNVNSNEEYTITLTDINNNPVVGESVTFNINSKNINAQTNADGKATIKINQNAGTYDIKVSYGGDGYDYLATSNSAKINVNKLSTKIAASNYAMFIKKTDYYKVTLKDTNGKVLAKQKITIKVNKKTYNVKTDAKGIAKIKLKLKKGTYKVQITYKGTGQYKASKATKKITVKKVLKTKLTAPKVTIAPATSTKYSVTLKDENGNLIKKQKVTVNVNGKKYTKKTNSKGQVTVSVKFSKLKTYIVKASFKKTKTYKKSSATGKITVQKTATVITADDMQTTPNVSNDYTVTLKTSAGKALAKQSLKITLNGQTYTKTTDANGKVTIQVKFDNENTYKATVTYAGSTIYKGSNAVGTINVSIIKTQLTSYNKTFALDSSEDYMITLTDSSGNALANQVIAYKLDNQSFSQNTDAKGQVKVNISSLGIGSHNLTADYAQTGEYVASSSSSIITIANKTGITYVDAGLPSDEIQRIFDTTDNPIEFLSTTYNDVSLSINRPLNITFRENTTLNGKAKSPVLTIAVSNFNITNLIINANEGSGIVLENVNNVIISNNAISNTLDSSKSGKYESGEEIIPGDGISISNASNVEIIGNDIKSFGNAIFTQNSEKLEIDNNTLSLSNYGITYGLGVKNTNITNNLVTKNIGLYVMDVPEGPLGYGIFLNQSAVNVSITNNRILDNYMGISVDANYSTGIVIMRNWISDNALEGIRFNAGYDLAENAVEPNVNDNAIYRNARGPSMMILGEMSANPNGRYHFGEFNDTEKLQLGVNWFGKNARLTWDYATNKTGYGTMCPRINATYISVKEVEVVSPGTYQVKFYKYDEIASNLPVFEMYATLNDNVEVKFDVVDGVGTFSFDSGYTPDNNEIKVSIGSLKDQYRTFEVLMNKTLETSEIPA